MTSKRLNSKQNDVISQIRSTCFLTLKPPLLPSEMATGMSPLIYCLIICKTFLYIEQINTEKISGTYSCIYLMQVLMEANCLYSH